MLDEAGVPRRSVLIQGRTRVSLNVLDTHSGLEYRFVPEGPTLSEAEYQAFLDAVAATEGEWVIASGSLPHGVPDDAYAEMACIAAGQGRRFALDTSGVALRAALEQGGLELVKPSLNELELLVGRDLAEPAAQDAEAMALVRSGAARLVAVTLGRDGALLAPPMACCGCRRWMCRCKVRSGRGMRSWGRRRWRWLAVARSGRRWRGVRRGRDRHCLRGDGADAARGCGAALSELMGCEAGKTGLAPQGARCSDPAGVAEPGAGISGPDRAEYCWPQRCRSPRGPGKEHSMSLRNHLLRLLAGTLLAVGLFASGHSGRRQTTSRRSGSAVR